MIKTIVRTLVPRIPREGYLDLTYRCNNNCRHCWLWTPDNEKTRKDELSFQELKDIVDEARSMGCNRWLISGGEPMLREDFPEIFDYITSKSVSYSLNTNGTLITSEIAQLLKRKGSKMIALYGATAEVHDYVTRNPGSFDATMRGFANMKGAGAGFIVQLVPMQANYHQFDDMVRLAASLSKTYRVGAPWLYLSACRSAARNKEIIGQRLDPKDVLAIDSPSRPGEETAAEDPGCGKVGADGRLFAGCIEGKRDFHVDPYGQLSFCCYVKDPTLRYDLRRGSFADGWEKFIPSLADKVVADEEYFRGCGSCYHRADCQWCPVYGYLEHGRFGAKVEYLCGVARETEKYKGGWRTNHRRYYGVGGMTICVESDLPLKDNTFNEKLDLFRVEGPGADNVGLRHHFSLPDIGGKDLGKEIYRKVPWAIYKKGNSLIYLEISVDKDNTTPNKVAVFSQDHAKGDVYHRDAKVFESGDLMALTTFPTDQILLAPLLADRRGLIMHSAGMVINGHGLLFIGHSGAGKSTTVTMLQDEGEILCDDRIIVRRQDDGFRIYGTWSHGTVPIISPDSAPLRAILLIEQSAENRLVPVGRGEIVRALPKFVVKTVGTESWWDHAFSMIGQLAREVPVYRLRLDKSGAVKSVIRELVEPPASIGSGAAKERV
ncbi:radical SAM protein [Methanocella sp. MCL-LM]|uniref:radical SAM protein n=1 Tax=Methanocella sp. MCL-LM TaxID=3412035 RepID=UPI003C7067CA